MNHKIDANIYIEDLIEVVPQSIELLLKYGIACIKCGAPIWGTLLENAKRVGLSDADLEKILLEINTFAQQK
jgi:methionine synthase II (cobalamin-independent)